MTLTHYKILAEKITYTGAELKSGWVQRQTGLEGDAAAAFLGPCRVATEDLVDLDDARDGFHIRAAEMAHVIIEHQGLSLQATVLRQRLLASILCEMLRERGKPVKREGDDLFYDGRKLTVSIAAPSRHSCLIHLGINVDPEGAPVPAVGLAELGVPPIELLETLLQRYQKELSTAAHAETKVRMVD